MDDITKLNNHIVERDGKIDSSWSLKVLDSIRRERDTALEERQHAPTCPVGNKCPIGAEGCICVITTHMQLAEDNKRSARKIAELLAERDTALAEQQEIFLHLRNYDSDFDDVAQIPAYVQSLIQTIGIYEHERLDILADGDELRRRLAELEKMRDDATESFKKARQALQSLSGRT